MKFPFRTHQSEIHLLFNQIYCFDADFYGVTEAVDLAGFLTDNPEVFLVDVIHVVEGAEAHHSLAFAVLELHENALIAFSTSAASLTLYFEATSAIHSAVLLSLCIIIQWFLEFVRPFLFCFCGLHIESCGFC